jgi:RHS repeat-associated protein
LGDYNEPAPVHEVVVIDPQGNKTVLRSGGDNTDSGITYHLTSDNPNGILPPMRQGDALLAECIEPGQSVYGTYMVTLTANMDKDEFYYKLINAFTAKMDGSNTDVPVSISIIPSHVTKYKLVIVDQRTMAADPVDTSSGAHVIERETLNESGASLLSFDIDYNSELLNEGTLGKGWSNNFESKLVKKPDGTVLVYWSPSNCTRFVSKRVLEGQTYGTINADGSITINDNKNPGEQEYVTNIQGLKDYILKQNSDGTYILTCANKNKYYFDSTGNLTKLKDKNKQYVTIERQNDGTMVITEPITEKNLTLKYNANGMVESVSDKLNRKVTFTYNNNKCLTKITDANGKTVSYTYDEKGRILTGIDSEGNTFFTDTYDDKGRISTQDDGVSGNELTKFNYDDTDTSGNIITIITDRNGNTRKNIHNSYSQLVSVEDELGNKASYTYDEDGNRTSMQDSNGYVTKYTYDDHGNLLTVTDAENTTTAMTYDENGNLLTVTNNVGEKVTNTYDSNNLLTSTVERDGTKTSYTYNDNGQILTKTIDNIGTSYFDYENGKLKTTKDFMGNITTFDYDEAGRLITVTDREGKKKLFEYDNEDNIISETDPLGNKLSYTYDGWGNKLSQTDARGNSTHYKYNENGKLVEVTDAKGIKTTYDSAGHVLSKKDGEGNVEKYTYDNNGWMITKTTPKGGEIKYSYYKNGKIKTVTDPLGNETTYLYDSLWRLSEVVNAAGKSTKYEYDKVGNLLSKTDPLGHKIIYTYDAVGNILTMTDANGNITKYEYNANGKPTQVTDALNNKTEFKYDQEDRLITIIDAKGNETKTTYDTNGRVVSVTDALGNTENMEYDAAGNLIKTFDAYGNNVLSAAYDEINNPIETKDALGNISKNKYDNLGRLVETIDALNRSTKYSYNKNGIIESVNDPLNGESKQTFDADGNLETLTDPNGNSATYVYDLADRLISETTAIGSVKTYGYNSLNLISSMKNGRGQETTYEYDDAGNLTSFSDPVGKVSYTYDANGNVLTVTDSTGTITREYDELNRVTKYTDSNGNTTGYSYDTLGNLIALTYPGGKIVRYEYDAANRLISVTDWENRVTEYEYDKNNRLVKTKRPNQSILTNSYDAAGRMTQQSDVDGNGKIINKYDYTYDEVGNIKVEKSSEVSSNEEQPFVPQNSVMTYGKGNMLLTYNGQEVKYDEDGNMIFGPLNGEMVEFDYDARNRLIRAGNTTYEYDAENNRTAVIQNGEKTEYINNPNASLSQLLIKKDSQGNMTYYVYGLGLIGHQEANGNYKTYHFDYRGSTTAITDLAGTVTDRFEYAAYGELVGRTGSTSTPFLYNGYYGVMTDSNGLYYMRARYYNPDIKRFINQDVLQGSVMDGRSLNRYAYVSGNPVSYIDPFGYAAEDIFGTSEQQSELIKNVAIANNDYKINKLYDYKKDNMDVFKDSIKTLSGKNGDLGAYVNGVGVLGAKKLKTEAERMLVAHAANYENQIFNRSISNLPDDMKIYASAYANQQNSKKWGQFTIALASSFTPFGNLVKNIIYQGNYATGMLSYINHRLGGK